MSRPSAWRCSTIQSGVCDVDRGMNVPYAKTSRYSDVMADITSLPGTRNPEAEHTKTSKYDMFFVAESEMRCA